MLRRIFLLSAFMAWPVLAEDAPQLAEFHTNSGSLPPEYAWEVNVSILADGKLTLRRCTGYETEGPARKTENAKVAEDALQTIRSAVMDSGLFRFPAREAGGEDIPVGGGVMDGAVYLDGQKVTLPAFPAKADAPRVRVVLAAIHAAIPVSLSERFAEGN